MLERLKRNIEGFLIALQFFSIVPIRTAFSLDPLRLKRSIQFLPVVGLLFGALIALVVQLLFSFSLSTFFLSLVVLTGAIALSGGLHIDGWMDMSDAYFSYRSIERRHEILKDSRVGAFAVLSLMFLLSWRFLFAYETLEHANTRTLYFLILVPFLSRSIMGLQLMFCQLAKNEGLAYTFKRELKRRNSGIYALYIVLITLLFAIYEPTMISYFLIMCLVALIIGYWFSRFIKKNFGGITGDLLGATSEGVENGLWFVTWLLHLFVMG